MILLASVSQPAMSPVRGGMIRPHIAAGPLELVCKRYTLVALHRSLVYRFLPRDRGTFPMILSFKLFHD